MADVAAQLRERAHDLAHNGPTPGGQWCEAWTGELDQALADLHAAYGQRDRVAVVATGGYGRREVCPGSDVDLLLLHEGLEQPALEVAVRDLVYPLWDAGLKVGYAVRSRRQAVVVASDVDVVTTMLDARWVAGSRPLVTTTRDELVRRLRKRPRKFLEELTAADQRRQERSGDASEVLEPDLKSGTGGLRDVQSLRWAAAALLGTGGLDPLVPAGYLGASDRARLAHAYERLLAERVALHLEVGRAVEVLRLDLHQAVALRLGYEDGASDHDTAAHRLLRDHFLAARTVEHLHRRAWALITADLRSGRRRLRRTQRHIDGFELVDDVVRLSAETAVDDPSLPTRLLGVLTDTGSMLERSSAERLRHHHDQQEQPVPWDTAARRRFLHALWAGDDVLRPLAELDDVGLLVALIPEWAPLRGRPQRNPFHRYSLDRHAWHAAAALGELVRAESWAAAALERVDDREALMLGALLHDIGKAHGEPHAETGIPVARGVAERLGASKETVDRITILVRHHLLLADAATRRDISDPSLARHLAEVLGDHETLSSLHLLTAADGIATGPAAWNSWKASLVTSLVRKVRAVLDQQDPDDLHDGAVATAAEAQRIAPQMGVDAGLVRDHLSRLPARYAGAVSPRAIVRHTALTRTRPAPGEVRTRVTPGVSAVPSAQAATSSGEAATSPDATPGPVDYRADGSQDAPPLDELDVVALDRPGLFAKVAGVIALHGGSVLAAHAYTREDGILVDTFRVARPDHATGSWWVSVEGDLAEAVAGRLALRARVARKAHTELRRLRKLPQVDTRVTVSEAHAGASTVVEVHTLDRIGVLYAITAALAELELDIVVARVLTIGHEVVDAFYVRDAAGQPLDTDHVEELDLAVRTSLRDLGEVHGA